MKVSDLKGSALDYAVGKCEGLSYKLHGLLHFSVDWQHAGPIIQREEISINREFCSNKQCYEWSAWTPAPIRDDAESFGYGTNPLMAAMRCYVASKLGDEIDIPTEIK